MNDILRQMWHTWSTGGWVMGALAVIALIAYGNGTRLLRKTLYEPTSL